LSAARRRHLLALGVVVFCGCGQRVLPPEGQVLLFVTTDAPLPPPPGEIPSPDDPPALFDRLRVDMFGPGDVAPCRDCTRDFVLDRSLVGGRGASFGLVPPAGKLGARVRLRMFLASRLIEAEPPASATVDVTVALPEVHAEGIVDITVDLPTELVGQPEGMPSGIEPTHGAPSKPYEAWSGARRVPCADAPSAGEACIPGGAYWKGNPLAPYLFVQQAARGDAQHLVTISPFYLDVAEVTVAEYRAFAPMASGSPDATWSTGSTGQGLRDWCSYTKVAGPWDAWPMNCLPERHAAEYCAAVGKRLPTEAELEYAMSGLRGDLYLWGVDEPACGDALFGLNGFQVMGICQTAQTFISPGHAPLADGTNAKRDVLDSGNGIVVDLAGSVREYAGDYFQEQDEPCWSAPGVLRDPVCSAPSGVHGEAYRVAGGEWDADAATMRAATRFWVPPDVEVPGVGFRCARSATPAR
jgi:formylglycine-generating enzyme required for sulfatase activity